MRELLGRGVVKQIALSADVWRVVLSDGLTCIVKRVPRQSLPTWQPGQPWAELVALDILAAEGAPVPKLVAADLERGFLVQSFIKGTTLREVHDSGASEVVAHLDEAVHIIEALLDQVASEVKPFLVESQAEERTSMFARVRRALTPDAAAAWDHLLAAGFEDDVPAPSLGSLDIQPENAIVNDRVFLIDFATLGRVDRERRIVGYVHRAHPRPGTLLSPRSYAAYSSRWGEAGALRLAAYDFAFTLPIIEAAAKAPRGGKSTSDDALGLWCRERFGDERLELIRKGLRWEILQELRTRR